MTSGTSSAWVVHLKIKLAVGGAVFKIRHGLMEEVGGDGTAPNAMAVPGLMDKLWQNAVSQEVINE